MYLVGDEGIWGEFRLYFDYLSEGSSSNDFIGYRGLKTLFRRLPEIRPATVDNLALRGRNKWPTFRCIR
jgi:hypothetical protein